MAPSDSRMMSQVISFCLLNKVKHLKKSYKNCSKEDILPSTLRRVVHGSTHNILYNYILDFLSAKIVMLEARITFPVLLWWITNGLASVYAKIEMSNREYNEMVWLDLTYVQILFGLLGSAFWIYMIERRPPNFQKVRELSSFAGIFGNLIGHLSVNVSYTFVSSSATQVVKSSEPLFMFFYLVCLRSELLQQHNRTIVIFCSIVLMVIGTCLFLLWDVTFNVWGVIAAIVSNVFFPLRNIALKNMESDSPFEKYFILSFFGAVFLFPFLVTKYLFQHTLNPSRTELLSGAFHCIYNLASITTLQNVSPMNHAILNFLKRIFVIILNIKYFNLFMTWHMVAGLVITFTGVAIYLFVQKDNGASFKFMNFQLPEISSRKFYSFLLAVGFLTLLYAAKMSKTSFDEYPVLFNKNRNSVATAWIFNRPVSDIFVREIIATRELTGASMHVYCGSTRCVNAVQSLKNPNITSDFFIVPNILGATPLKVWGEYHAFNKVLLGIRYEWYLTQALCLAHLWLHGGHFYLPSYGKITFQNDYGSWPCMSFKQAGKEIQLPPRDERVRQKMETFLRNMNSWQQSKTVPAIFQNTVWNAFSRYCEKEPFCLIPSSQSLPDLYERDGIPFENQHHFGTLSYDGNVASRKSANVGDEMQGFAGMQFLPFIDFFLDREYQVAPNITGQHLTFFNAWWGNEKQKWPPSQNIEPIMLSIHAELEWRKAISSSEETKNFLKSKAPIGARDVSTQRYFKSIGVPSFFSGCMTLFLKNPDPTAERDDKIYITDVKPQYQTLLPKWIVQKANFVTHGVYYGVTKSMLTKKRFVDAYERLRNYSRAKLVITQRIHAALPCVAIGTPVVFLDGTKMSAPDMKSRKSAQRFKGLLDLFHSIRLYNLTDEQAKERISQFNWADPPRNPNLALRMRLVASMWYIFRNKLDIYESARRFGMFPLTPQWLTKSEPSHMFHLIHNDIKQDGGLTWDQWRCIESILRHHPTAKLMIYSNIIEQSLFDVLTEVGYQIIVKTYKLTQLVQETPLQTFFKEMQFKDKAKQIILNQHGVLKFLLLYKYGGVFLTENTIVLKPIDISQRNVVSLDSELNVYPWMLNFQRNHKFLGEALKMFPKMYSAKTNPDEGKALLSKVCEKYNPVKFPNFVYFLLWMESFYLFLDIVCLMCVIQKYTKFADFTGLYFRQFKTFHNQTWTFFEL